MKKIFILSIMTLSILLVIPKENLNADSRTLSMTVSWNSQYQYSSHQKLWSKFTDEGSWDELHTNSTSLDGYDTLAKSKDGGGQWVTGRWAYNEGDASYANQGARRGSDYAYTYH